MKQRKLEGDAQALDELLAQSFDGRSTLGKNVAYLRDYFARGNNTEGIAMLRGIAKAVQSKGMRNVDKSVDVTIGPKIQGSHTGNGESREMIGRGAFSGQRLVQGYQVGYTIAKQDGTKVQSGYLNGTRLDSEMLVGIDHLNTLLLYKGIINDPEMPQMLRMPQKQAKKQYAKMEKTLPALLKTMPEYYRKLAERNNVNLAAMRELDVLKAGKEIAKGEFSALLAALDPGKNRNELNWFAHRAKDDELPVDVRQAWQYLKTYPHLLDTGMMTLLGAYQMQMRAQPRKGIAGSIAEELQWLATGRKPDKPNKVDRQAETARTMYQKMYNCALDLQQKHEPARFYTGDVPVQDMTIEQKLGERNWTVADREGIIRKFPMRQFREAYNAQLLNALYANDERGIQKSIDHLRQVRNADAQKVKQQDGDTAGTRLGDNYEFVNEMLGRMKDTPVSQRYRVENLVKNTPVYRAKDDFERLRKTEWFLRPLEERHPNYRKQK